MNKKIILDFSKEIRERDLVCDCDDQEGDLISMESWASEKNKGKKLNKPFRTSGGPKKFSVYVKNEKGNVVKVNFGDPNMEIKRDDPARRKSFRARHNCDNPGPKTKARYWSCKQWRAGTKVQGSGENVEKELLLYLDESEAAGDYMEKAFMKHCASYDGDLINTAGMDQDKTYAACAMQYKKMKGTLYQKGQAGLTEKQKTLPKPIQEAILKKQGEKSEATEAEAKRGLWDNIHNKRKRIKDGSGEKMRKKGDKGAPSEKQIKKAQKPKEKSKAEELDKNNFKPHKMYDPKTGKAYDAKTYEDHVKMKKMGYTHTAAKKKKN
jgi:hypothetical protein